MKKMVGLALITLVLTGCNEDYVKEVKSSPVTNYAALSYQEILDNRKLCTAVEWRSESVRNTPTVFYTCTLKNEDGVNRAEKIVWEKSRAMNGFTIVSQTLEEYDENGETKVIELDVQKLMYGAVYDLIDMKKYLKLHFITQ